jgi:hypothetical protein
LLLFRQSYSIKRRFFLAHLHSSFSLPHPFFNVPNCVALRMNKSSAPRPLPSSLKAFHAPHDFTGAHRLPETRDPSALPVFPRVNDVRFVIFIQLIPVAVMTQLRSPKKRAG